MILLLLLPRPLPPKLHVEEEDRSRDETAIRDVPPLISISDRP